MGQWSATAAQGQLERTQLQLLVVVLGGNSRSGVCARQSRARTDEAVKRQRLSENEDQDHADEELRLLRVGPVSRTLRRRHTVSGGRASTAAAATHTRSKHAAHGGAARAPCPAAAVCSSKALVSAPSSLLPAHLTPASPTMPMAMPAASPARPQERPEDRCANPSNSVYFVGETARAGAAEPGVSKRGVRGA